MLYYVEVINYFTDEVLGIITGQFRTTKCITNKMNKKKLFFLKNIFFLQKNMSNFEGFIERDIFTVQSTNTYT